ncbi:MAG TPA: hypothetical protein VN702_05110 [Acetobacteraceae bacterium]|jgi:hypothetical protein|nr:hypothetical protein [Acetobacteraceae bacterium]
MLDLMGIMFSSVIMLFVIVRAVQLDSTQPWFQTIARNKGPAGDDAGGTASGDGRTWRVREKSR